MPDRLFAEDTPIFLRGVAYDPEDGIVSGGALEWRLDGGAAGSDNG